jgi:putative ATP-dependent DNA ligase
MDDATLREAIALHRAEALQYGELTCARLTESIQGLPRGSVVLPGGVVVPGYPPIARIHSLASGLQQQFHGPFRAEEKVDGFNVRILQHAGQVYAFSRGGFVCPFSTDRLPDFLDLRLFEAEPDLVLCAEIAGPENPYLEGTPPYVTEDVQLFVFDLMRKGRPGFLPPAEKDRVIRDWNLPAVRSFGRFQPQDVEPLRTLILTLDAAGAEGLVLKAEDDSQRAKYVTGSSSVTDIRVCARQLLDLPPEYFTHRLMRLAVFLVEHDRQGEPGVQQALGAAFLEGLDQAVAASRERGRVDHRYRCRFRERENALRFMAHMGVTGGSRVQIAPGMPRRAGEYWELEFERIFDRMTGTLATALSGASQFD